MACSEKLPTPSDATPSPHDAGAGDAEQSDRPATSDNAGPVACAQRLVGQGAFGRRLTGAATFVLNAPGMGAARTMEASLLVDAYFPTGRRPGETVIFAVPTVYPRAGLSWSMGTRLTADGGALGVSIAKEISATFTGDLVGPDQGLDGKATINFAFGTDVGMPGTAMIRLCPTGDVPAAVLTGESLHIAPTSPLWFAPSTPPDPNTLSAIDVTAGGVPVPITTRVEAAPNGGNGIVIAPVTAFPPNTPLAITARARDLLGRAYEVTSVGPALTTTAVLTDGTFTIPPPAGAIVSTIDPQRRNFIVVEGALVVSDPLDRSVTNGLVALGDPGGATNVRLHIDVDCGDATLMRPLFTKAAVVGARGEATPVPLACGLGQDLVLPRPASGPLWLSVAHEPPRPHPQAYIPYPSAQVRIDAITFE